MSIVTALTAQPCSQALAEAWFKGIYQRLATRDCHMMKALGGCLVQFVHE